MKPLRAEKNKIATVNTEEGSIDWRRVLEQIAGLGSMIAGYFLFRYLGIIVLAIFSLAGFIGFWFPNWYLKRKNISNRLIQWITWSNLATWLLPPLGVMTGFAALGLSEHIPSNSKKYKIIAIIGIVASLLNAFAGILMNL